jgi:hypothetical protein
MTHGRLRSTIESIAARTRHHENLKFAPAEYVEAVVNNERF